MKRFIIVGVFSLISFLSNAQNQYNQLIVEDFRQNWLVSSKFNSQFTPYIKEIHKPSYIHFYLNLNKFKEYHLSLMVSDRSSLFINNDIIGYYESSQVLNFSIDSLNRAYNSDKLLITIYSEEGIFEKLQTSIVDFNPSKGGVLGEKHFSSSIRVESKFEDFSLLSIFLIALIGIILKSSNGLLFKEYFSFRRIFSLSAKSEILYSISFLSTTNLFFLLYYGVIVGFSITNIIAWTSPKTLIDFGYGNTSGGLIIAAIISLMATMSMFLKYPLLKTITNVFMFRKATPIHFHEYLRFSFILSFLLFAISFLNSVLEGVLIVDFSSQISWALLIFFIARSIFIYFKLNNLKSFRNLHLFSYLCSTEIIPLITLLKIFNIYIGVF